MNKPPHLKIVKIIQKQLSLNKNVLGVLLYGSVLTKKF